MDAQTETFVYTIVALVFAGAGWLWRYDKQLYLKVGAAGSVILFLAIMVCGAFSTGYSRGVTAQGDSDSKLWLDRQLRLVHTVYRNPTSRDEQAKFTSLLAEDSPPRLKTAVIPLGAWLCLWLLLAEQLILLWACALIGSGDDPDDGNVRAND